MCVPDVLLTDRSEKLKADNPTLLHAHIIPGTHKYSENLGAISKILGARRVTCSQVPY